MFLEMYYDDRGRRVGTIIILSDGRFWPTLDSSRTTPLGIPVRSHYSLGAFDTLDSAREGFKASRLPFSKRKTVNRTSRFSFVENYYPRDPGRCSRKIVRY